METPPVYPQCLSRASLCLLGRVFRVNLMTFHKSLILSPPAPPPVKCVFLSTGCWLDLLTAVLPLLGSEPTSEVDVTAAIKDSWLPP